MRDPHVVWIDAARLAWWEAMKEPHTMSKRTTVDAIRIQYDRRTDIIDIYPGTRPERIHREDITSAEPVIGWPPYTHRISVTGDYGDPDYYLATLEEAPTP